MGDRCITLSTYQEDFRNAQAFPPLFEFQPPSFNPDQEPLQPRCYPIAQPSFPQRKRESDIPIALGFNTVVNKLTSIRKFGELKKNKENEIDEKKESAKENQTDTIGDVPQIVLKELIQLGHYTPSSQMSSSFKVANRKMPPVKLRMFHTDPKRFDNSGRILWRSQEKPEVWQKIGCVWDKLQERKPTGLSQNVQPTKKPESRLLNRPRIGELDKGFDCINKLSSNIPGYGGYQPRLPTNHFPTEYSMQSTSNVTYRKHPKITYRLPFYGHKAPMSRTVTLTQPYNPFNKVVKEEITTD